MGLVEPRFHLGQRGRLASAMNRRHRLVAQIGVEQRVEMMIPSRHSW